MLTLSSLYQFYPMKKRKNEREKTTDKSKIEISKKNNKVTMVIKKRKKELLWQFSCNQSVFEEDCMSYEKKTLRR